MFEDVKTIPLTRSYSVHGSTFDKIVMRAPKMKELMVIGAPTEWQPVQKGDMMYVEYLDRIDAYLQILATAPTYDCLMDLALPDALAVKAAVVDFFTQAEKARSAFTTSSSSASGEISLK